MFTKIYMDIKEINVALQRWRIDNKIDFWVVLLGKLSRLT